MNSQKYRRKALVTVPVEAWVTHKNDLIADQSMPHQSKEWKASARHFNGEMECEWFDTHNEAVAWCDKYFDPAKKTQEPEAIAWSLVTRLLRWLFESSANAFWKVEARAWRKLFEEQRGGQAFTDIQQNLVDARVKIDALKSRLKEHNLPHD